MTRYQTNRLARKACVTLIKWGWRPDLDKIKSVVNRRIIRIAKSNGRDQKTTSEMAAEMAKELILSMSDMLSYPDSYSYYFQKLFNLIYNGTSVSIRGSVKTPIDGKCQH